MLRVDPATGKVLWQKDRLVDEVQLTGRFIYVARAQISHLDQLTAAMNYTKVPVRYRLHRRDSETGEVLREYNQPKAPAILEERGNSLLLQDQREVRLLKFMLF